MNEQVVLVDEYDTPTGTAPKESVHTGDTPLHRGFSCFIFDSSRRVLITRRAAAKKTFPGILTNAVCGHPAPDEDVEDAVRRRLDAELGLKDVSVTLVSPYRYRAVDQNGIVENEICPIFVGATDQNPVPNPDEVGEWFWTPWADFLRDIDEHPELYSLWSREEARVIEQLDAFPDKLIR